MATAESVKAKIQGLIDSANAVTGNTDTDLTTAITALTAGYGQGGSGSGGDSESNIQVATGSFTKTANGTATPEIVHNLGTKKIIAIFWIPNDVVVTPTAGYQVIATSFINTPAFVGDSIQVDCTVYNSNKFTEVSTVDYSALKMGAVVRSPWTTQSNFTAPNVSDGAPTSSTITENTLTFVSGSTFIAGYTYNYMIIGFKGDVA